MRFRSGLVVAFGLIACPLFAHEFWIDPVKFQVAAGGPVVAEFRVGQNFKAPPGVFLQTRTTRHEYGHQGRLFPVPAQSGDRPAMRLEHAPQGLVVLIHETTDSRLTYADFQKFADFIEHKRLDGAVQAHKTRGLPDRGFTEGYRRFAKSLVAVGHGQGQDFATGLQIEIVALKNPYTDDLPNGLPVQVLLNGAPRAGVQVEVFEKPVDSTAPAQTITTLTTNGAGIAHVPVTAGHIYMLDNVALLPVTDASTDMVWRSLWANLAFQMP